MKKLLIGIAWAVMVFIPLRAHALQFDIPQRTYQSTTTTNASIVFSTANANGSYMNCLQHVTVTANAGSTFGISFATVTVSRTLSAATTSYAVLLSSGVPYDSQWSQYRAYCTPPNTQMTLFVTSGNYTISCEQFTSQGLAP